MKKLFLALVVTTFLSLFAQQTVAMAVTELSPSYQEVEVGDIFAVALSISDVPEDKNIGLWEVYISFDPSLLGLYGITFGDPFIESYCSEDGSFWLLDGPYPSSNPDYRSINMWNGCGPSSGPIPTRGSPAYDAFSSLQPKDFILATVYFEALAEGESDLILTPGFVELEDVDNGHVPSSWESANVSIRSAPEPSSLALLALGLAGISFACRKKA